VLQSVSGSRGPTAYPVNQFNIGNSIGEGEAADGTVLEQFHPVVWSTGYDATDAVYSLNERLEDNAPEDYSENSAAMDVRYNKAASGAKMADFVSQATDVVAEATTIAGAGMVTILLGNNDVCASTLASMTDPSLFEQQYRDGLDVLAASPHTQDAAIHVSGLPGMYWLWVAMKGNSWCRWVWSLGSVCQAMLQNPEDDCETAASRDDPHDAASYNDGPDCLRRKEFHRMIRDIYNPILQEVLQEYRDSGELPNAYFVDIFDVKFSASHVNDGDCFHPSISGHALLADEEWCRSPWGSGDPECEP